MTRLPHRFWRLLRSRRLAVWLIITLAAYSAAATAVPRDGAPSWLSRPPLAALGLDRPFAGPLFLALAAALTLSTAACAWERSSAAVRTARTLGAVTPGVLARLRATPALPLPPGADAQASLAAVETALRSLRLRTRRGSRLVEARGGTTGLAGSPLFHWALAALFVVVGTGRLTRAEGMIGVPVGGSRIDEPASYGVLEEGPLYSGHTGLRISAEDFALDHVSADDVSRGPSPVVSLHDGERLVARGRVYPNAPLRHGALLVHADGFGLASWVSLVGPSGETLGRSELISDFDAASATGTTRSTLSLLSGDDPVDVSVAPVAQAAFRGGKRHLAKELPEEPLLVVHPEGASPASLEATLAPGEAVQLPGGSRLRFERQTYYARLSVVDDWSVPLIYALFVLTAAALALSVLVPFRVVRVLLSEDGQALHVEWRHARRDPLFDERVREALGRVTGDSANAAAARSPRALYAPAPPAGHHDEEELGA